MGQRLELLQPDAVLRSALRRPICSSNPLPCCAQHISALMYFRGLLSCRMEVAQQVVCLAAARPRHAIGSHGVDCHSVKQMSFYENTRIGTLFSEVSVLFNMVQCARKFHGIRQYREFRRPRDQCWPQCRRQATMSWPGCKSASGCGCRPRKRGAGPSPEPAANSSLFKLLNRSSTV